MVILDQIGDTCDGISICVKAGADVVQTAAKYKCKEIETSYVFKTIKKAEKSKIDLKTEEGRQKFSDLKKAVLDL